MATLVRESYIVNLSRLVKDKDADEPSIPILDDSSLKTLEQAVEGLVDDSSVIVEIGKS